MLTVSPNSRLHFAKRLWQVCIYREEGMAGSGIDLLPVPQ